MFGNRIKSIYLWTLALSSSQNNSCSKALYLIKNLLSKIKTEKKDGKN